MKKLHFLYIFLFLALFISSTVNAQIEVVTSGDVGIGTSTPNAGGYNKVLDVHGNNNSKIVVTTTNQSIVTALMSSPWAGWGGIGTLSNHPLLFWSNNTSQMQLKTSGVLKIHNSIQLGNYSSKLQLTGTGSYGEAANYNFNPYSSYGIVMEQGYSESGGFYVDGDYAVIWSPGDGGSASSGGYGYLLKVIDEDGMNLKWYLDGAGYDYHVSDSSLKYNIQDLTGSVSLLKDLNAVKFNYKPEDDQQTSSAVLKNITAEENGFTESNDSSKIHQDALDKFIDKDPVIDTDKYDPSQKTYFGFLAQDVEAIFPDIVDTDENGKKFVSYTQFIPILVEALNEQQDIIDNQNQDIELMKQQIIELQKFLLPKEELLREPIDGIDKEANQELL